MRFDVRKVTTEELAQVWSHSIALLDVVAYPSATVNEEKGGTSTNRRFKSPEELRAWDPGATETRLEGCHARNGTEETVYIHEASRANPFAGIAALPNQLAITITARPERIDGIESSMRSFVEQELRIETKMVKRKALVSIGAAPLAGAAALALGASATDAVTAAGAVMALTLWAGMAQSMGKRMRSAWVELRIESAKGRDR